MQEKMRLPSSAKGESGFLHLLFAFLFPVAIVVFVFAIHGVYPFGPFLPFIIDLYQQYFPFVSLLKEKLLSGGSLMWSWEVALGANFLPLIAYYLASPLNLLIALVLQAWLREAMTAGMIVRVGLAGLSCAVMLRQAFGRRDVSLVIFSLAYALCGFSMGYFWNTIWMDTFALAPLVMLGTLRLMRGEGPILYAITLALAIWCNFLMGLYTCIFVLLLFACLSVSDWNGAGDWVRKFIRIGVFTVLAFGLTAALLLPMVRAFGQLYRDVTHFPSSIRLEHPIAEVIGNFAAMVTPTTREGLPNVYTGVLPLLLAGCFFRAPGVRRRDRALMLGLSAFLLISLNVNALNFLWNGMTLPHQLPYRFSFLLSLMLAVIASISYGHMEKPHRYDYVGMLVAGLAVITCAALGGQPDRAILATFVCVIAYLALFILWDRGAFDKAVLGILLLAAFSLEIGLTAPLAYDAELTRHDEYYHQESETRRLLAAAEARDPFARVEVSYHRLDNEPALFGYRGVSGFSSTIRSDLTHFIERIGGGALPALNRVQYHEGSPFIGALYSLKYHIARDGEIFDGETYFQPVERASGAVLFESRMPLSLGYMVRPETLDFTGDAENPFLAQGELFRRMTGVSGALYGEPIAYYATSHRNQVVTEQSPGVYGYRTQFPDLAGEIRFTFEMPREGLYYAFFDVPHAGEATVIRGEAERTIRLMPTAVTALGRFEAGERVALAATIDAQDAQASMRLFVCRINEEVFAEGYERLSAAQMHVTAWEDTLVEGWVDAEEAGLLYTSIPYDDGWTAYVDGNRVQITPLRDAMVCLPLEAGRHTLRFTYQSPGWPAGLAVSGVSVAALAGVAWARRRRRKAATPAH